MRRAAVLLAAIGAALWSTLSPAAADDTVVVRGLAFPSADTYLTYFGCTDLFHRASAPPQVRIGQAEAPPSRPAQLRPARPAPAPRPAR